MTQTTHISNGAGTDSVRYLRRRRGPIVEAAYSTLSSGVGRYARNRVTTRARIAALYEGLVEAIAHRNATSLLAQAREIADERFRSGYDLSEVQTAFNALEEAIWADVFDRLPPEGYATVLADVSMVLGGAKDALAREYVLLATGAHAPAVDLEALARGVERS